VYCQKRVRLREVSTHRSFTVDAQLGKWSTHFFFLNWSPIVVVVTATFHASIVAFSYYLLATTSELCLPTLGVFSFQCSVLDSQFQFSEIGNSFSVSERSAQCLLHLFDSLCSGSSTDSGPLCLVVCRSDPGNNSHSHSLNMVL